MGKNNSFFVFGITLVATLGGLLFGYDTAVISGTVSALKEFFLAPLYENDQLASRVIVNYKVIVSVSGLIILLLIGNFLIRLFGKRKGLIISAIILSVGFLIFNDQFLSIENKLTENLVNSIQGFTVSSALIGCIIGGSLAGWISQSLGRKIGLLLAAMLFLVSALGSALPDYLNIFGNEIITSFIFYRILGGIGVGIASMLSPMYIAEIAPADIRGKLVSWNQFAIIFGMLVVYFINYSIANGQEDSWINTQGWRYMFASEMVPAGLFFLLLFFVPETPRYLVQSGKEDRGFRVLERINGNEGAAKLIEEIKLSVQNKHVPWLSFGGMVIVIGIMLSVFQQFVGINVVLYYAPEIFRNMGSQTDTSLLQTIIVGAVNLSFTVIAIITVDKFGRKPLMIIGAIGMGLSMLALGFTFYFEQLGMGSLVFMLLYTASFAMSWGPVTWVMLSEIFPNSIRSAMSIAVAAQWIANLIISWTFPMLNDNKWLTDLFHHGMAYWIYGLMGFIAAWFMWRVVPETKNKTLEEMETLWNK